MSKTPSVAVVGCGYWGKNLVRNFNRLGALGLVCDATAAGRSTAAELVPNVPFVNSIEDVLHSDVSGVVIATPAETHYDITKQALNAGKDVFVEKPLALTYEQGADLVRIAENKKADTDGRACAGIPSGDRALAGTGAAGRTRQSAAISLLIVLIWARFVAKRISFGALRRMT